MRTLPLLSAIVLAACGSSHSPSEDAGSSLDAGLPSPSDAGAPPASDAGPGPRDAGPVPDTGPPRAELGAACETDAECQTGVCLDERTLNSTGGMCSASCADGSPCPEGSACRTDGFCWRTCDWRPDSERTCEREGFECGSADLAGICLPTCYGARFCAADQTCDRNMQCRDPLAEPRGACRINQDCAPLEACLQEHRYGFPDGQCTRLGCASDRDCDGGLCLEHTRPDGEIRPYCAPRCATGADCREGYACVDGACRPSCESDLHCTDPFTRCDVASGLCRGT